MKIQVYLKIKTGKLKTSLGAIPGTEGHAFPSEPWNLRLFNSI